MDSSDTERIGTSAEEFHAILDEEELKDALILVYANKQARAFRFCLYLLPVIAGACVCCRRAVHALQLLPVMGNLTSGLHLAPKAVM